MSQPGRGSRLGEYAVLFAVTDPARLTNAPPADWVEVIERGIRPCITPVVMGEVRVSVTLDEYTLFLRAATLHLLLTGTGIDMGMARQAIATARAAYRDASPGDEAHSRLDRAFARADQLIDMVSSVAPEDRLAWLLTGVQRAVRAAAATGRAGADALGATATLRGLLDPLVDTPVPADRERLEPAVAALRVLHRATERAAVDLGFASGEELRMARDFFGNPLAGWVGPADVAHRLPAACRLIVAGVVLAATQDPSLARPVTRHITVDQLESGLGRLMRAGWSRVDRAAVLSQAADALRVFADLATPNMRGSLQLLQDRLGRSQVDGVGGAPGG